MSWCPKCKYEYREGFKICSNCNIELVEKLDEKIELIETFSQEEFLVTAKDELQANMIEALLNSNNIPVLRKYRELGGYLKVAIGTANFGVDIYVAKELIEEAKELIKVYMEIETSKVDNNELKFVDNCGDGHNRRAKVWVLLFAFFIPGIIFSIYELLKIFFSF